MGSGLSANAVETFVRGNQGCVGSKVRARQREGSLHLTRVKTTAKRWLLSDPSIKSYHRKKIFPLLKT